MSHLWVERLQDHPLIGRMIAHQRHLPGSPARHADPQRPLRGQLRQALSRQGVDRLFSHQAEGLDQARAGRDVLVVTPTASGKTLLFALAVIESLLDDPRGRAIFVYPTKALARDQLGSLRDLAASLGALGSPRFEIYDGDTPAAARRRIKHDPPQVLLTNPDMLHLGLLARHEEWAPFLGALRYVVLDELHVYRGIFGSHVHHILARLQRLCGRLGAHPQFIAASATVGNPAEFAATLVGRSFHVVSDSGAPRAPLSVLLVNPANVSPYTVAVRLLATAAREGLRTIAFTKARRVTELLYTWLVRQEPELAHRVAPYRAGYLPEERRELEARLFRGDLLAVVSTSALELGIDVGGLDLCLLVGYPGSLISSWQRIGRVGRGGRPGVAILVAMPDSLDQYLVHHPELFFRRDFEKAVLDPWNPYVASRHVICAASEWPLTVGEVEGSGARAAATVAALAAEGRLVQDVEGEHWLTLQRRPHREVHPRAAGEPYSIVHRPSGRLLGRIDGVRVYHECHPGAIYLHGGDAFLVHLLDRDRRRVEVEPVRADHFTVVLGDKETEILSRDQTRQIGPGTVHLGRLKVTLRVREYQKRRLFDGEPISNHPLDLPPIIFETVGLWIELAPSWPAAFTARELHFMGGIHAVEHALIGLFPLLAIAERGDVGGISYTGHPQTGGPAIFIYDAQAGGAGLAEQGYRDLEALIDRCRELLSDCTCEDGCPACIQSPQCGNGNRPLDKRSALLVLRAICGEELIADSADDEARVAPSPPLPVARRKTGIVRVGNLETARVAAAAPAATRPTLAPVAPVARVAPPQLDAEPAGRAEPASARRLLVFDVETQRSAAEVGGWAQTARMGLALAVVCDLASGDYRTYFEPDVHRLLLDLVMADCVIGFNIDRFDLGVLSAYTAWDLSRIRTLDLLTELHRRLGFRVSLNHLAEVNLGRGKSASGEQSLRWWKEGRLDLIETYCRQDVEITRQIYELGRERGHLLVRERSGRTVRVGVNW